MKILEFSKIKLNERYIIAECREELKKEGHVVMLPLGGTYALACSWQDEKAKENIYKIRKSRSFQMFHWDFERCMKFGFHFSRSARKLALKLCPAPLTIIDNEEDGCSIAFQIPQGPSLLNTILEELDIPLALIGIGKNDVEAALKVVYAQPDLVADMGELQESVVSTVVELKDSKYKILRDGAIKESAIRGALS